MARIVKKVPPAAIKPNIGTPNDPTADTYGTNRKKRQDQNGPGRLSTLMTDIQGSSDTMG